LDLHQVEFISFIDEVIKFFEIDLEREKKKIDIIRQYPKRTLLCRIDTEQFRQVILNLLHNAIQAMPHGGRIVVGVNEEEKSTNVPRNSLGIHPQGKRVILKISDNGTGMSKATLNKVFTPFFTTKEHGTGLGLSTVKKIVEAHRGDVRVESKMGKGTTVIVRLSLV
jgi:signal transduction histidine kinase